jgi:hypothetical protein
MKDLGNGEVFKNFISHSLFQVARCIKRFSSDLERERHIERLH